MSNQQFTLKKSPSFQQNLKSFWKFSRPHTIIGTSLSVIALYLLAVANFPINFSSLPAIFVPWLACLCGNIYIVGLNQLEDVEIDKINKPHLPLAAGEFSLKQGRVIVGVAGILALILSAWGGIWLLATVGVSLLIGSAYSLPPIRLKRFPLWAAFCIFTVRGVIVNLGIFLHFSQRFTNQLFLPKTVWVLTWFIVVFTVAIAIFKDVPDLEGDKQYKISTFTLILGKEKVFNLARYVITLCYLGMIGASLFWHLEVNTLFLVSSHIGLLTLLWLRSQKVNLEEKQQITDFYQFIWKLFFIEYILYPLGAFL